MAVQHYTFSNDLKSKELTYPDNFFKLKGQKIITGDNFTCYAYDSLKDIIDFKTNNYSNIFLLKKQKNSEWLEMNEKPNKEIKGLSTTLKWEVNNKDYWLYFPVNYELFDISIKNVKTKITYGKNDKNHSNHLFYINFIDQETCKVQHTFGDLIFYLAVNDKNVLYFTNEITQDNNHVFKYILDGEMICLYKIIDENIYSITVNDVDDTNSELVLENCDYNDIDLQKFKCRVVNPEMNFEFYMDSSWIKYDRSRYISSISDRTSAFELMNQAIIHHEYNNEGGFNFIPLKNDLTYKGNSVRGNNMTLSYFDYPDVDYRNYTSLYTGFNQEKGNDTIILTFNFSDQEYTLKDGEDLIFTIDENVESDFGQLYPYDSLKLKDTKFIKNGSFGSNVPFFADKIKKLQNKKSKDVKNGNYLCSWLYKKDDLSIPLWKDRYYNPLLVSEEEALNGDYIENYKNTFYDIDSELKLEPGRTYRYQRLSTEMVQEVLERMKENRIQLARNNSDKTVDLFDEIVLDNDYFIKLNYKDWKKTNVMNYNMDIYLSPKKRMGLQLFGSDYTHGFTIQNRKDLCPFHYYYTNEVIYLCNNKFVSVHELKITETFNEKIRNVILGDIFDDVVIITSENESEENKYMYILAYDLMIKHKFELSKLDIDQSVFSNNILLYKNNLYIPVESQIYKVVMCPDNDEEKKELENKNIFIRRLHANEYFTNSENIFGSNTNVEGNDIIQNVFIDEDGIIYGLNFKEFSLSSDKDTIYGISDVQYQTGDDSWFWLYNQSLSKIQADVKSSTYAEFSSPNSIDKVRFNELGEMCLIRNFTRDDADLSTDNKRMDIYDKTKSLIYTYDLSNYDTVFSLDSYTYIDENNDEQICFTLLAATKTVLRKITYLSNKKEVTNEEVYLPFDSKNNIFTQSLNNNSFARYRDYNALYFNLRVFNEYMFDDLLTIKWDLSNIQEGWYNINVEVDLDNSLFEIKINDIVYETITNETHPQFQPYMNSDGSLFNNTYYVGVLGKKYGTILNNILKNSPTDPYLCKNTKIKNISIYNKKLSYHEYQAMRLKNEKINDLILTLPCGIRNSIDEMVRFFKYNSSPYVTNKVKINIAGVGLKTQGEIELLKKEILGALENKTDCLINIENIDFI